MFLLIRNVDSGQMRWNVKKTQVASETLKAIFTLYLHNGCLKHVTDIRSATKMILMSLLNPLNSTLGFMKTNCALACGSCDEEVAVKKAQVTATP